MKNGHEYLIHKNYDSALLEFQAAQIAARECGKATDLPATELKNVFAGLKQQRDDAIAAKQEAERARQQAVKAGAITRAALAKAEKLITAFYFYDGRFALSVKQVNDSRVYGFINKNGDPVIPYRYVTAEQFDYTGFAKVKRKDHYGEVGGGIFDYLVDTAGREYEVTYKMPVKYDTTKPFIYNSGQNFRWDWQALDLRNSDLDSLPKDIAGLEGLRILLLHNNKLTALPPSLGNIKTLENLDLGGNKLENLPSAIGQWHRLSTLNVSSNHLKTLPAQIGQLQNLRVLDLSRNQLESLPPGIEQLRSLKKLVLSSNPLKVLPAAIGGLTSLKTLLISANQLTVFPLEVLQLSNLETLDLSSNTISVFPSKINLLKNLHTLDVSSNDLKVLPAEIIRLKNLRKLYVYGNPMTDAEYKRIRTQMPNCTVYLEPLLDVMQIQEDF